MMQATARANASDWLATNAGAAQSCVRDLRALLIASAAATYAAAGKPIGTSELATVKWLADWDAMVAAPDTGQAINMTQPITWSDERATQKAGAVAIISAWQAIAERNARQRGKASIMLPEVYGVRTEGASESFALIGSIVAPTAGNPVVIAAIVAGSAALAYLGAHAIDAYERNLSREKDTQRLTALTSAATTTLATHAQADQATGKVTPLTPAELAVMAALTKQIDTYKATTPPAPEPTDWSKIATSATSSLVTPLVLLGGLYLLLRKA